ncbi:MAG: entericidin A/B family lipoprotein [Thiotrichaceae bacterium]
MQNKIRNVISRLILGTLCLCVVTACSTVEGVGEDISKAGQVLSDASRKEQGK